MSDQTIPQLYALLKELNTKLDTIDRKMDELAAQSLTKDELPLCQFRGPCQKEPFAREPSYYAVLL